MSSLVSQLETATVYYLFILHEPPFQLQIFISYLKTHSQHKRNFSYLFEGNISFQILELKDKMPPKPFTLLLLIPAATTGVLLTTYLYSRPFAEFKSKTYKTSSSLSPSTLASKSLSIVNPRKHIQATDSRSVTIPSNLTDEELLARFTKGYFNGWVFTPEKSIFAVLGLFGRHFIKVGFSSEYHGQ